MWAASVFFLIFTTIIIITSVWITNQPIDVQSEYLSRYASVKTDMVYLPQDIRDLLANSCKLPYIFLSNDDVDDYIGSGEQSKCGFRQGVAEEVLHFSSSDGTIELLPEIKKNEVLRNTSCSYHKLKNYDNKKKEFDDESEESEMSQLMEPHELTVRRKTRIPFFDFAVVCKDKNNPMFVKPFLNFANVYKPVNSSKKNSDAESVALLFLPAVHHKLFTKFFVRTKNFMLKNQFQLFKMFTKVKEKPTNELINLLGLGKKLNIFQKATDGNFSSFFFGPEKVENLVCSGKTFNTSRFRKFRQKLLGGRKCMDDGKKIFEDDMKIFEELAVISKNSKVFSTFFIDDYGKQKNLLDEPLWFALEKLKTERVFERSTVILTTYSVSESEESDEERNPLFAIRLSDRFKKQHSQYSQFLNLNVNRLMSTLNMNALIASLLSNDLNGLEDLSPLNRLFPGTSNCTEMGIPKKMCLCMEPKPTSTYNKRLTEDFLKKISKEFHEDLIQYSCVKNITIYEKPEFFDYYHLKKGELRVVELIANVTLVKNEFQGTAEVRQTYKFEPFFSAHHAYDNARLMRDDGTNIAASQICN